MICCISVQNINLKYVVLYATQKKEDKIADLSVAPKYLSEFYFFVYPKIRRISH